jgi:hypothetical protein
MKYMFNRLSIATYFLMYVVLIVGCKKSDNLTVPPLESHFTFKEGGAYLVTGPDTKFLVPFGITTVSKEDVRINVSVSSPTGAVEGTHYTLATKQVLIPAGQTLGFLEIKAFYPPYETRERSDRLVFKIEGSSLTQPIVSNSEYTLSISGDYDPEVLKGAYNNTNETLPPNAPYGPYKTTISSIKRLSPTTAEIVVENIFDVVPAWKPITFKLDWTDPADFIVTLNEQSGIGDAGVFGSSFAGQDISVRALAGQSGTFSFDPQKIVLVMQLGVTGQGWISSPYTVTMER